MKLKKLIQDLNLEVKGSKEVEITGISSDSRRIFPGNLFIAKKGGSFDAAAFIPDAINAGASAVLSDLFDPFLKVVQLICPSPKEIEAKLGARYYGEPSKELFVVGVTGTKGKTTTSYLIKHILDQIQMPSALVGTIETIIGENRFSSTLTTHDVISNQKWLREMVQKGCGGCVLECSSHGLIQGRLDEIAFDLAIFTNLTPDHLDYHGTVEEYARAKRKLFERAKRSILNADSPWANEMGRGVTFGIERGDVRAEKIGFAMDHTVFEVQGVPFYLPLIGKFNVYNALAAIAVGLDRGASLQAMQEALRFFRSPPARLQRFGNVFIDFAHNGEALENVLATLREVSLGKIIVVFGCGGNRDPERRTGMAKAAEAWADETILTNDNPRKEDPEEIIRQIQSAFAKKRPKVELDRKKAIEMAIQMAKPEDCVLIAGKGHERVQIFAHQTVPFDDAEIVRGILG